MKVLFLYPNIKGMNMLPPAIGLFSALLRRDGHQVDLFDSTTWSIPGEDKFDSDQEKAKKLQARPFDDSMLKSNHHTGNVFAAFREKIERFQPDLLAVSVVEDIFPVSVRFLESIADIDLPVIMGGVFPTFAPDKCLALAKVDMVCVGEGEDVLVELCRLMEAGRPYHHIPGLWAKSAEGVRRNPLGRPVDMDQNPLLDFSVFEESRLYRPMQGRVWRMLPVETHRGCPYQCTYCNSPAQQRIYHQETGRSYYRKKSFVVLERELRQYKDELRAEALYFWADTFLSYTDREFDQFCEVYQSIRLPFWMQTRPETIREDRLQRLMALGLFRMGLGVEHGNEEFRRKVLRRRVSNRTIVENLKILNRLDLKFSVNNIVGFPTETRNLAMDTVRLNREIDGDSANMYSFSPFHGTPLRVMAERLGFVRPEAIARSLTRPTLLNMPQFPPAAIEGFLRCFILYVKMPEARWAEIGRAEALTPEGDRLWEELRAECADHYVNQSNQDGPSRIPAG